MNNIERANMIFSLCQELACSVENYEKAKAKAKKDGRCVYAGVDVDYKDSLTSIHRKITLIREQLMVLAKEVKA